MILLWPLVLLFLAPLVLQSPIAGAANSPKPCIFPKSCSCTLEQSGKVLLCTAMQLCLNQRYMDQIGEAINTETCPVEKFSISCSVSSVWPIVEITQQLFHHDHWTRLKKIVFGTRCSFVFRQRQVLLNLPRLNSFALHSANISLDLGKFSDIFCCPPRLSEFLLQNIGREYGGSKLGYGSFIKFHALSKITILGSNQLMDKLDFLFNTTSPSFNLHWHGNMPDVNRKFSSINVTNLAATSSALELDLYDNRRPFVLDAPANIVGFNVTKLGLLNVRIDQIGDSPFQGFTLKDLTVTNSGLNDKLLPKLLNALGQVADRSQLKTLALQFRLKNRTFPYEAFNALCTMLPLLRGLTLSSSTISFTASEEYLKCPQLQLLSLNYCNLKDTDLPPGAFRGLTQLKNLHLTGNSLDTFPKEVLRTTEQIAYLEVSQNFKMELRASSLHGILPNLEVLRISHTGFVEPLTDAFIGQPKLTQLQLIGIRPLGLIECPFKKTWFQNCSNLRSLSLSNNVFFAKSSCHADGFFDPLESIENLDLNNCGFGKQTEGIVKTLLRKLPSLKTLKLTANAISNLEHILSIQMPNLTVLDVSYNEISFIPRDLLFKRAKHLQELDLTRVPIVNIDPLTFSRMPQLRIKFGGNQFACTCELLPFTDWLRTQWSIYQVETKGDWLYNAVCYTGTNETIRLIDFHMSWWDCYSRRLIVLLSSTIAALVLIFGCTGLLVKYRWKLHYNLLSFCIRHHFVKRLTNEFTYDGCFIYDETDEQVSQWVENLINKLEADLQLRLYEPDRDAPVGANILDEAASAIDKSRHAVLVLTRGFLENRLNLYSAQWSNESLFIRRTSLAVMVMKERLSESELMIPGCKVLHRLYRMCKPDRIVDCIGCGVSSNSANRLGLMLYKGARADGMTKDESDASETDPLME